MTTRSQLHLPCFEPIVSQPRCRSMLVSATCCYNTATVITVIMTRSTCRRYANNILGATAKKNLSGAFQVHPPICFSLWRYTRGFRIQRHVPATPPVRSLTLTTTHTQFSRRSQVPTRSPQQATAPLTGVASNTPTTTLPVPSASLGPGRLWYGLLCSPRTRCGESMPRSCA